jgi:citrate/tricarballylate utilization protein
MFKTDALEEADRVMTICNSCRYCEGFCAVFPAMEKRLTFAARDLNYLANLCHQCGACVDACQFSPPHPFGVRVPSALSHARTGSYAQYAWPPVAARLFRKNAVAVALVAALSVALFFFGFATAEHTRRVPAQADEAGLFYQQMPHQLMVLVFGGALLYAVLALFLGARRFWRDISSAQEPRPGIGSVTQALRDAARLRYLDGGGSGCPSPDDAGVTRRGAHHLVFYGFLLCFASTCVATLYHYVLGREAPYPWYDLPVLLGTFGGLGVLVGTALLYRAKTRSELKRPDSDTASMEAAFLLMLFLTAFSGLALLALRHTPALAVLLPLHLGIVFSFFVTMPYGKFVHGLYRWIALLRYAHEQSS